jgi:hypothetical protein
MLYVGLYISEDKYAMTASKAHVLAVPILVIHTVPVKFVVFSSVWFYIISTLLYMLAYHFRVCVSCLTLPALKGMP